MDAERRWQALRRISTITSIYRRWITAVLLGTTALLASCQKGKMPDQGSYAAQLYLNRCGQCHQAYNPSLMTAPMWAVKVDLMQERMKQTGLAPLTPDERETILEYLSSNAGQQ
jgi:mono/diheme cytochrome c family protein